MSEDKYKEILSNLVGLRIEDVFNCSELILKTKDFMVFEMDGDYYEVHENFVRYFTDTKELDKYKENYILTKNKDLVRVPITNTRDAVRIESLPRGLKVCLNCEHYQWDSKFDRYKGGCSIYPRNELSIMVTLPKGLHGLTKADNCGDYKRLDLQ